MNKKGNKEYEKPDTRRERERERERGREMNEREWNMLWVMGMTSVKLYEFCLSVCLSVSSSPLLWCSLVQLLLLLLLLSSSSSV